MLSKIWEYRTIYLWFARVDSLSSIDSKFIKICFNLFLPSITKFKDTLYIVLDIPPSDSSHITQELNCLERINLFYCIEKWKTISINKPFFLLNKYNLVFVAFSQISFNISFNIFQWFRYEMFVSNSIDLEI